MGKLTLFDGTISGAFQAGVPGGLAVNMDLVPGVGHLDKFGVNPVVTPTSDPEVVWEFGGMYPWDADGTAPILYMSSSSAADVGQPIRITGLDIDGYEVNQIIISNGQNNVLLETPLWRVYRMSNFASTGGDVNGIMYVHTDAAPTAGVPADANVRAIINGGKNQTLMTVYTVPRGKVAFLERAEVGVQMEGNAAALAEYAHLHYESRRFGKCFLVKKAVTVIVGSGGAYIDDRMAPDVVPAMTDIQIVAEEVSATMGLWATFDMLLVDERAFEADFLKSITQPGY